MLEFARRSSGDLQDVFRRVGEQRTLGAKRVPRAIVEDELLDCAGAHAQMRTVLARAC